MYELSVKIMVYSRYENVAKYLEKIALECSEVMFRINDDSGSSNTYPELSNVRVTYSANVGHDESYYCLLDERRESRYSYIISDAVILNVDIIASIAEKISSGRSMYFLSHKELPQIDFYWYLTKTGFVVYRNDALRDIIIRSLPNFPQLNYLAFMEVESVERIVAKIIMVENKKSYWSSNMHEVWFEDFYEGLSVFVPRQTASLIVKRHAFENHFFSLINMMRWGLVSSLKSVIYLLRK